MNSGNNAKGMERLILDAVHAAAAEQPGASPLMSDERLLAALSGENPLTAEEQRRLLLSVDTQGRLAVLAHAEHIKALDRWAESGYEARFRLAAAADEERRIKPIQFEKPLCTIDLIPIDAAGKTWRINVTIARESRESLVRATPMGLQLVDSEGLVWLKGHPDEEGEIVGFWQREEDLWERLHRIELELKPA